MSYIGNKPLTRAEKKTQQHNVSEGQTEFPVSGGYTVGLIDVFLNGVLLLDGIDYIANNGLNVDLVLEAKEGDTLVTVAWGTFTIAAIANKVDNGDPRLATAWAAFDGTLTGTNPPTDGFNVASITRTAAGAYTVNFETPMDNTNYSVNISANERNVFYNAKTVNSVNVFLRDSSDATFDGEMSIQVYGGKD